MFYSRPDIESPGWDLKALPEPDGSRNHLAETVDGKTVGFRFSSGWLTVRYSETGSRHYTEMERELFCKKIAPFGVTNIFPEQLCDLMGLTVRGQVVAHPSCERMEDTYGWGGQYIDLSGRLTYWRSSHRMLAYGSDDAHNFVARILKALPDAIMIQSEFSEDRLTVRKRQISQLMHSDEHVLIGTGLSHEDVRSHVESGENTNVFPFSLRQWRHSDPMKGDITNKNLIKERHPEQEKTLRYDVINHRQWFFSSQYESDDDYARICMGRVLDIIEDYFKSDVQVIDLQSGRIVSERYTLDHEYGYYSKNFRDWCLEKPERYIAIGYEPPESSIKEQKIFSKSGKSLFYGFRPL